MLSRLVRVEPQDVAAGLANDLRIPDHGILCDRRFQITVVRHVGCVARDPLNSFYDVLKLQAKAQLVMRTAR